MLANSSATECASWYLVAVFHELYSAEARQCPELLAPMPLRTVRVQRVLQGVRTKGAASSVSAAPNFARGMRAPRRACTHHDVPHRHREGARERGNRREPVQHRVDRRQRSLEPCTPWLGMRHVTILRRRARTLVAFHPESEQSRVGSEAPRAQRLQPPCTALIRVDLCLKGMCLRLPLIGAARSRRAGSSPRMMSL